MAEYERSLTIEWGDCDEAGIVFYPTYFYWFDCTWQGMLRSKGLSQRTLRDAYGAITPLVDVGANFRSPVSYDDVITISAKLELSAAARLRIAYRVRCGDRHIASGHELRAWAVVRPDGSLKGASVPPEFIALFEDGKA
jgi:YbgC/YbaW family acyl-CoA thioester hydrolase